MFLTKASIAAKLDPNQFVPVKYPKTQIVLHHTAGHHNVSGVIKYWNSNAERVATAYLIDDKGKLHQCFDDEYYAYALYVNAKGNRVDSALKRNDEVLNRGNIGIELTNAGGLTSDSDGKWLPWWPKSKAFAEKNVHKIKFRGYEAFEVYYEEQIKTLQELLLDLFELNPIIRDGFKTQDLSTIFDVNTDALNGKPGIYTHVCYRTDKSDVYPYPPLIEMLKKLQDYINL